MALIRYKQDDSEYAIVTGRMHNIKFRESVGDKGKPLATFSIAYDWTKDEFDKPCNLYMNCVAWSNLAEFVGELIERKDRTSVLVAGKVKVNEWNGERREQIECDFIQLQQTTTFTVQEEPKPKRKKEEVDDFDDINF